jgi:hypothetical protein
MNKKLQSIVKQSQNKGKSQFVTLAISINSNLKNEFFEYCANNKTTANRLLLNVIREYVSAGKKQKP